MRVIVACILYSVLFIIPLLTVKSIKSDVSCILDRGSLRGDFNCSMETCYNFTSGIVVRYRTYCIRFRNKVISLEERSDRMLKVYSDPVVKILKMIRSCFIDWVGLNIFEKLFQIAHFPA